MNFPADLKYSKEHEWVRVEGNTGYVGISDFAQKELGDIVYVEIESIGETFAKDAVFGTVEAVKTVSDLFMPVGGKVLEKNNSLNDNPEAVNTDPYGKGWIFQVKLAPDGHDGDDLLDPDEYEALIAGH